MGGYCDDSNFNQSGNDGLIFGASESGHIAGSGRAPSRIRGFAAGANRKLTASDIIARKVHPHFRTSGKGVRNFRSRISGAHPAIGRH